MFAHTAWDKKRFLWLLIYENSSLLSRPEGKVYAACVQDMLGL